MLNLRGNEKLISEGEEGDKSNEQILNIKVDGNSAARIVVNIEGQNKVALIDTGAGRCCMNEEQYQTLGSTRFWNLWMWGSNCELPPGP